MQRREGTFLQAPILPSHFWVSFLPFCFKCFFLASSSSQAGKKKKKKKNHREEKKWKERKELSFKLPLYFLTFGSRFCLPTFALMF